ncbi:MAG: sel1 repeat family protein, partial [Oscillospiraceae bacterium]|nr:sel1 repeat family protein [Oscillospiraceae bacterium]
LKSENIAEALSWLTVSVEADNPYAMYLLGKLYWEGEAVPQDKEQAVYWLTQAAAQGHTHAQILLERQDSSSLPSAILAVNSLLHQMGRIFQDNAWPKDDIHNQHTDRKLRRKIQQKRIAMGHKPDDHEEQRYIGPAM